MTVAPPILPSPRDVSLLTNTQSLPDAVAAREQWRDGLSFAGNWEGLDGVRPSGILCEGDEDEATIADHFEVTFKPFMVDIAAGCETGMTPETSNEVAAYARAALDANTAYAVEQQFYSGTADATVPHLQSVASVISGGPFGLIAAVGQLLGHRAAVAPSSPTLIHGPVGLVPFLEQYGLITRRNGTLVGADGWRYIPGAGYPIVGSTGTGPWQTIVSFDADFGDADLGVGTGAKGTPIANTSAQVWLYATGVVEYADGGSVGRRGDQHGPFNLNTFWDSRTNRWIVFEQKSVIYRFDPFNVFAALTTVPT